MGINLSNIMQTQLALFKTVHTKYLFLP